MFNISALVCGLLFGLGLAASGMTDPAKVIGFLDIFGSWDPDLLFVMGSAVVTTAISFRFVLKKDKPFFASVFSLPTAAGLDKRLLVGASLFGIGWGLYGYCPGPAIASLGYFKPSALLFVLHVRCKRTTHAFRLSDALMASASPIFVSVPAKSTKY